MKKHWNIGFCIDEMLTTYPTAIWSGIVSRAKERGVNVILIAGGGLDPESENDARRALLYRFLRSPRIDGFILNSTVYTKFHTNSWVKEYFDQNPISQLVRTSCPVQRPMHTGYRHTASVSTDPPSLILVPTRPPASKSTN